MRHFSNQFFFYFDSFQTYLKKKEKKKGIFVKIRKKESSFGFFGQFMQN